MTREEIGAQIKQLRHAAGISQEAAARHAGLHVTTWIAYEHGRLLPSATRWPAVAAAVDAPIGAFYNPSVVAEVALSPATLADLAANGQPAVDAHALRIANTLRPRLALAATTMVAPTRQRSAVPLAPLAVSERLVAAKREGLRLAEWQLREAQRAESVE